jgi:hypothetical protein
MTTPASPVNSVGSITPVTGTPESVAGIATRVFALGLGVAEAFTFVLADGDDTNAGSTPATPLLIVKLRLIFCAVPPVPT